MENHFFNLGEFTFNTREIQLISSIKYHAIKNESANSESYSFVKKKLLNYKSDVLSKVEYRRNKKIWVENWREVTFNLLGFSDIYSIESIREELEINNLSTVKRNALINEVATFIPYFEIPESNLDTKLDFSDEDRKLYLEKCAEIISIESEDLTENFSVYEDSLKKISKSLTTKSYTPLFVTTAATLALVFAPYIATVIGGNIAGLSGGAAFMKGLALLGGGSLASGGLGIQGGFFVLMSGGAILGYLPGTMEYRNRLDQFSNEEIISCCAKLYTVISFSDLPSISLNQICDDLLNIQIEHEKNTDKFFITKEIEKGEKNKLRAKTYSSLRSLIRGDL